MAKFYEEEQRQKELQKESEFILRLWEVAFSCARGDSTTIEATVDTAAPAAY